MNGIQRSGSAGSSEPGAAQRTYRHPGRDSDHLGRMGLALHADVSRGWRHSRNGNSGVAATDGRRSRSPWSHQGYPGTETRATPKPLGPVLFWFFVRLVAAAGVLYVSLRSLDGKVAALLLGLALTLVALFLEAIRLFRGWSA